MSRLTARHGAYFVTGNHEYYSGVHGWVNELRRLGLAVLLNEHVVRLQQPFTAGLHRLDTLWIYISRGTGCWRPPKRLGASSEITLLRLAAA